MEHLRTVVITGSNKGIGYGLVENLVQKSYKVIMACRNVNLANQSRDEILRNHSKVDPNNLLVAELDISNEQSIDSFVASFQEKFGHADVLVNNAGIATKGDEFNSEIVANTFKTNFYGTMHLSEKFLPLLKQNGKIVTVGSTAGLSTRVQTKELKQKFLNPNLTRDELISLAKEFYEAVKDGSYEIKGYQKSAYGMSKLCINLYTNILAQNPEVKAKNIQIYTCCPGYVKTDMTSQRGYLTIEEGCVTPLWLIEKDFQVDPIMQGNFFSQCKLKEI